MRIQAAILCWAVGSFAAGCDSTPATTNDASTAADTVVATDTVATTDAVATTDTPAVDGGNDPWACLGRVPPVTPSGTMVTITVNAVNASGGDALAGLTVKACGRDDLTCATPHSMGTTNAMGAATLMAPVGANGFNGYIELSGGAAPNEVLPTRMFPNPALAAGMQTVSARLILRSTFALLGGVLMAQLNDTNGLITTGAGDCNRMPAAGVLFSAMPMAGRQFYTGASGIPSLTETQTTAAGSGGFANVPPGTYTLTATRASNMARIGAVTVSVRGGYVTSVNVGPSP